MKTLTSTWGKLKLLFIFSFFLIFLGTGCEDKEPQYEIYENHEISACGVEDPLVNLEWLKRIKDEIVLNKTDIHSSFNIDLYEERETKNHVILIPYSPDKKIYDYPVYNCSGELTIYHAGPGGEIQGVPPAFPLHSYCTFVGTLWSVTVK